MPNIRHNSFGSYTEGVTEGFSRWDRWVLGTSMIYAEDHDDRLLIVARWQGGLLPYAKLPEILKCIETKAHG